MIDLVISGGQSGADLAGNEWARQNHIPTIIKAFAYFKPFKIEDHELYYSFPHEHYIEIDGIYDSIEKLRRRTLLNVKAADATLIFVERPIEQTKGSRLTVRYCRENRKYFHVINLEDNLMHKHFQLKNFMSHVNPKILNIAGERFVKRKVVIDFLNKFWEEMNAQQSKSIQNTSI